MPTLTLTQAGTGNSSMKLLVTYTAGAGGIEIAGLAGGRDQYDTTSNWGSNTYVYCNIAGTTYTLTPSYDGKQEIIFGASYDYKTFWYGSQAKFNMTGTQTVEFTFSTTNTNTNISNSRFVAYIDAGSAITSPTLSAISVNSISRTGVSAYFNVINNGGAAISDSSISCSLSNFGDVVSGVTGTSGTLSGLLPNTTYYIRGYASNGSYSTFTNVDSFTTLGNPPNITSVNTTPTIDSCDFDITVAYDVNDSYASRTIEYGTTEEYGSSVSGTTITELEPNTKYYYKITITSTQGRVGTYTGNFTTLSSGGKVRYKVNGTWKEAKVYLKVNGEWKETVPFMKENGTWEKGV